MSRLEIDLGAGCYGTIKLDGKKLDCVTAVNLDLSVGDMPKAQIDLVLTDCVVRLEESEANITPRLLSVGGDK